MGGILWKSHFSRGHCLFYIKRSYSKFRIIASMLIIRVFMTCCSSADITSWKNGTPFVTNRGLWNKLTNGLYYFTKISIGCTSQHNRCLEVSNGRFTTYFSNKSVTSRRLFQVRYGKVFNTAMHLENWRARISRQSYRIVLF